MNLADRRWALAACFRSSGIAGKCAIGGSIRTRLTATRFRAAISGHRSATPTARNPFYESMREVAPGDLILSFMDTRILAVGIAQSYCWESPKPLEFGNSGQNWEDIGWRVKVSFTELNNKVRPKEHIDILRPLLPARYSPLQPNGNGLQSVYLTEVPTALAEVLIGLIGPEITPIALSATEVKPVSADDIDSWEQKLEQGIADDASIPETDRLAIIRARKGQGLFKERVGKIEARCRITGVENPAHLV